MGNGRISKLEESSCDHRWKRVVLMYPPRAFGSLVIFRNTLYNNAKQV
jgi:hypothetical protein